MQTTVDEIQNIIEKGLNAKPRISKNENNNTVFKINTHNLISHELVILSELRDEYSVNIEVKRSGTGLLVIIEH